MSWKLLTIITLFKNFAMAVILMSKIECINIAKIDFEEEVTLGD